jgi:hypothetical protein
MFFFTLRGKKEHIERKLCACLSPLALALRAIVIGIRAVIGAVVAGSVVGYEVCVHCDFSCELV